MNLEPLYIRAMNAAKSSQVLIYGGTKSLDSSATCEVMNELKFFQ